MVLTELNTHFNLPGYTSNKITTDEALVNRFRQKQLMWIARIYGMLLDEPDKIEGVTFYHGGPAARPQDQREHYWLLNRQNQPTKMFFFFQMLAGLNGTRLATSVSEDARNDVRVVSSRDGQNVVTWIFNDHSEPAEITLKFDAAGTTAVQATTYGLELIEGGLWEVREAQLHLASQGNRLTTRVSLPAYGMTAVNVPLQNASGVDHVRHVTDYFGGDTMQPLPQRITIELPEKPTEPALLRLGLQRVLQLTPEVRINGQPLQTTR
ncbi:MAG: hypothetical protein HC888_04505 [Candidatus Competibacteraceae bacterium]|nr:hypothetical protein [Candidatus Competibacteraceae bacterium]